MGECIDLMHRTMSAVSEGRVVLPLRSVMVMPGDLGMLGNMPGYLAEPACFGVKLVSLIPRNKPPQFSSQFRFGPKRTTLSYRAPSPTRAAAL